jgi:hypothetical protein
MCLSFLSLSVWCKLRSLPPVHTLSPTLMSIKNQRGFQTFDWHSVGRCHWIHILSSWMYQAKFYICKGVFTYPRTW